MRVFLGIAFIFFISLKTNANSKIKENCYYADSSRYHLKILDSIADANPFDTSVLCKSAIKYMETLTKIKASSDGNYLGKMLFNKKDVILWRKYINEKETHLRNSLQETRRPFREKSIK